MPIVTPQSVVVPADPGAPGVSLPLPDGPSKALRLEIRGVRAHLQLYLAAVGPRNLELTGEIADGWLAIFFSPEHSGDVVESIATGRRAAGRAA